MISILFAVISYIGWGTSDIFGAIATRKVGSYTAAFYAYLVSFLVSLCCIPFALKTLGGFSVGIVIFDLFLGCILLASTVIFFEAFSVGKASIVGTIASSFTALVVIFSIVFLKETVTPLQIIAIIVICLGMILTMLDFKEIQAKTFRFDKSIFLALITMFMWGIYFTFIKIPINHVGWFWANFIALLPFPLLLLYTKKKGGIKKPTVKNFLPIVANGSLGVLANYSFNFAISNGLTAVVAPISGSYPTLFVLLAFFIFKEPIKKQQITGICVTLVGIVFLSIVSR